MQVQKPTKKMLLIGSRMHRVINWKVQLPSTQNQNCSHSLLWIYALKFTDLSKFTNGTFTLSFSRSETPELLLAGRVCSRSLRNHGMFFSTIRKPKENVLLLEIWNYNWCVKQRRKVAETSTFAVGRRICKTGREVLVCVPRLPAQQRSGTPV